MALKDWKKIGTSMWQKGPKVIAVYGNTSGWVFNDGKSKNQFKTKLQALKFAKAYMRKN